uniref:Uncharacterized protein n=1 Tax=Setaria italica TaxID=4555 RepID=K3ZZU5_SETIT
MQRRERHPCFLNLAKLNVASFSFSDACALGDAYVRFNRPLERESFMDKIFQLTPEYQLHFIKHDEVMNARLHDLDREAWVMLMGYPLDAKNNTAFAKAVAGFGLLRYWHDTNYRAIIVVRVFLHDDAKIPHDVTVSVGLPSCVRSWTCPIFALKKKNVTMLADEDPVPEYGPMHPLPAAALCWMGPNPANPSSIMQDLPANDPNPAAPHEDAMSCADGVADDVAADSITPGPSAVQMDINGVLPEVVVVPPKLVNKVINPPRLSFPIPHSLTWHIFRSISLLDIDLDTLIPSYIVDHDILFYLASLPVPQPTRVITGPALPPNGLPLVPYTNDEDDDEVREIDGPKSGTPSKRRARKLKEPMEDVVLRRIKRLNADVGGFRNEKSALEATDYPTPIEVVPPMYSGTADIGASPSPVPHLPIDTIQSMATGFLQMQPNAIGVVALLELDNDDDM